MQERLLGGLTARDFLRRHWQRKPLLARGALPHSGAWLTRRELFGLARLPQRGWTLLVSGVNLHDERAEKLLRLFDFLPRARLDDVMVSYAVPGGGVGPHRDSYDVFLVQGPGRRLWRLERARRFARVEGAPLDLIADFRPDTELLVETGDLLYLPPGWGHDGRALGPCFTYSVGLRAPHGAELGAAFLDFLHERGLPDAEYRDPGLAPSRRPARLPEKMIAFGMETLRRIRWSRPDVVRFLGGHLTARKPEVVFRPRRGRPRLAGREVRLDPKTRLLYSGRRFFVNGEDLVAAPRAAATLRALADRGRLAGGALARAGLADLICEWYRLGYLDLRRPA